MNVYLYFCAVCGAIAVGLLFAAIVDYFMEKSKCHGKHEQRGAK